MDITSELRNDLLLKEVGHRIAVMRQRARLTQEDFAAKSGISRSALQRLERGHEGARLLTFLAVLRTLGRIEAIESVVPRDEPTPMELAEAKAARPPKRVRRRKGEAAGEWKWGNAR